MRARWLGVLIASAACGGGLRPPVSTVPVPAFKIGKVQRVGPVEQCDVPEIHAPTELGVALAIARDVRSTSSLLRPNAPVPTTVAFLLESDRGGIVPSSPHASVVVRIRAAAQCADVTILGESGAKFYNVTIRGGELVFRLTGTAVADHLGVARPRGES